MNFKCKANSCLPSVVTDGTASVCDTSTGTCKCGKQKNAACTSGTTTPVCMVTTTGTSPTAESDVAYCQVIIIFKLPVFTRKNICNETMITFRPKDLNTLVVYSCYEWHRYLCGDLKHKLYCDKTNLFNS